MMRPEDEPSNDFQDYTLVAVVAVAAHLMKAGLGEDYGLGRLAERYGHDAAVLDQVRPPWRCLRLCYMVRGQGTKPWGCAPIRRLHCKCVVLWCVSAPRRCFGRC